MLWAKAELPEPFIKKLSLSITNTSLTDVHTFVKDFPWVFVFSFSYMFSIALTAGWYQMWPCLLTFQFHFSCLSTQDYAGTRAKVGFIPQSLSPRHDLNQNTDILKPFTEPEIGFRSTHHECRLLPGKEMKILL